MKTLVYGFIFFALLFACCGDGLKITVNQKQYQLKIGE